LRSAQSAHLIRDVRINLLNLLGHFLPTEFHFAGKRARGWPDEKL
jgi:hypothetical protein